MGYLEKFHELAMRKRVQDDYVLTIFFTCPLLRSVLSKIGEGLMLATLLTTSKHAFENAPFGLSHRLGVLQLQNGFVSAPRLQIAPLALLDLHFILVGRTRCLWHDHVPGSMDQQKIEWMLLENPNLTAYAALDCNTYPVAVKVGLIWGSSTGAGAAEGGLLIWVVQWTLHGSQQCVCLQLFYSGLIGLELLHPLLQPV